MKNEIILYSPDDFTEHIEVKLEDETVWLSQQQMATLFCQTKQNISLHINNCYKEGELEKKATVKEYLTIQQEGKRQVKRKIEYYNLDVIISVGYRVKSKQGTQFRIWATQILKDYLLKGYPTYKRVEQLEDRVSRIEIQISTKQLPSQGVFFDGQVYDAYTFASDLIRSADKSLILIDNYVDDTVLTMFTKRKEDVDDYIMTKSISKQLQLDLEKHNQQYRPIKVKKFANSHDRFLIIDQSEIYHIGASLKDLGKKWFAFSKLEANTVQSIMNEIKGVI